MTIMILGRRGAADRGAITIHPAAGGDVGEGLERSRHRPLRARRAERDPREKICADVDAGPARSHVDRRRRRGDHDRVAHEALGQELAVVANRDVDPEVHLGASEGAIGFLVDPDQVRSRRQPGDPIVSRSVGDDRLLALQARRSDRDDGAGHGRCRRGVVDGPHQHRGALRVRGRSCNDDGQRRPRDVERAAKRPYPDHGRLHFIRGAAAAWSYTRATTENAEGRREPVKISARRRPFPGLSRTEGTLPVCPGQPTSPPAGGPRRGSENAHRDR